jgi:hypothetical protein
VLAGLISAFQILNLVFSDLAIDKSRKFGYGPPAEVLMPEFSLAALPEIFVSDSSISKTVYEAVERGKLRKLGSRLYTRNPTIPMP